MRPFEHLIPVEEALALLLEAVSPVDEVEEIPLIRALHRVTAEAVVSPLDVPPFDRAAMDGYALRSADAAGAGPASPARLRCVGALYAGSVPEREVGVGECIEIATGAPLPPGADAVVMVEDTRLEEDRIEIRAAAPPGRHTTRRAADIAAGEVVLAEGTVLTPARIGSLAAIGRGTVRVYRRPRVAVGVTGSELVSPGEVAGPGQIHDVNSFSLGALLESLGCDVDRLDPCPDDLDEVCVRVGTAIVDHDLVILSGGSSVGERDLLQDALGTLGTIRFHGIAVKPGKPTMLAMVGGRPVLGMPGYPTSCLSNGYLLLLPAVERMTRRRGSLRVRLKVPLAEPLASPKDKHQVMTVRLEGGRAFRAFKESGVITSMSRADGFVEIPVGIDRLEAGAEVEVILL